MNKLTNKEYLQGFTVESLRTIAKEEFEIALSYKDENGKRQRYTKAQLIEMIIEASTQQNEVVEVETVETTPEATTNELTTLSINEVVKFAVEKVKTINTLNELHKFKNKLLSTFDDSKQTKKRTLKSKWALQYNRLQMLFNQAERKLHA